MVINELGDIVSTWATGQPLVSAAYLYGSRVKGTHRVDSDLDVAIEIEPERGDSSAKATWICEKQWLTNSLQSLLPMELHLEWYDEYETPTVKQGLEDGHIKVFERSK